MKKKFGQDSCHFDGTSDHFEAKGGDFDLLGEDDFDVSFHTKVNDMKMMRIFDKNDVGMPISLSDVPNDDDWHHIILERKATPEFGSDICTYVDGKEMPDERINSEVFVSGATETIRNKMKLNINLACDRYAARSKDVAIFFNKENMMVIAAYSGHRDIFNYCDPNCFDEVAMLLDELVSRKELSMD